MGEGQQPGVAVADTPTRSGFSVAAWAVAALLAHLALVDAALETFWTGSPLRWWVSPLLLACAGLGAWLWRPGGKLLARFGPAAAAATPAVVLLGVLAITAWLPAGQEAGVRMFLQPTARLLVGALAVAVVVGAGAIGRTAAALGSTARFVTRAVVVALGIYTLASLGVALRQGAPFAALLRSGALFQFLPRWLQGAFIGGLVLLPLALVVQVAAAIAGRAGRPRRIDLVQAIASALALAVVAAGLVAPAGSAALGTIVEVGAGVAQRAAQDGPGLRPVAVASLRLPVPRTADLAHVAPEHFAAALGKDPSRMFEFVRDQVAYEPYVGCLRGPRGTLLALAGNSIDRAALLASLLTSAGQRVRFARGPLPDDRARLLVASVFSARASAGWADPSPSEAASAVAGLVDAGVKQDAALLASHLKGIGLAARADVLSLESLAEETRDHYWVQWWHDGAWVDLDPSFASSSPGAAFAQPAATFEALPDALFHRVDLRIRLEEYKGAAPSSREILAYSAKAADLSGVDLALVHLVEHPPDERSRSGLGAFGAARGQAGQVRPFLVVHGQVVTGSPFWQTAPRKGGGAGFDSFLGGGEEAAAPEPVGVAEFLQLEFVAPGGRKDSVVREIFDLVGPARRRRGEGLSASEVSARTQAAASDAPTETVSDIFVTTGSLHAAHLENVVSPPEQAEKDLVDVRGALERLNILFAVTSDGAVDRLATPEGGVCRFYLDSPRVHIVDLSARQSGVRLSMDLRRDRARAVGSGVRREFLFAGQVLRGLVGGHLERALIDHFAAPAEPGDSPAGPAMSTSLVFELARAAHAPVALLDGDATALESEVPADARARLEDGLASGCVAMAPKGPVAVAGAPRFGWWQVDRRTGVTTAVTDEGLHAATVEVSVVHSETNKRTSFIIGFRGFGRVQHIAHTVNSAEADAFGKAVLGIIRKNALSYNWTEVVTSLAL